MHKKGMTFKELESASGVPMSTLHNYASAKVTKHTEDTLRLIAEAFGDPYSVIKEMRAKSEESYEQEKKLLQESQDAARMAQLAALIRSNVSQILEEYREQALAQQIETSRHADERVRIAEQKAEERVTEIERKAQELIEAAECDCHDRIKKVLDQCEEHEQMHKQHCMELMESERRAFAEMHSSDGSNSIYLRTIIRNLTIALIVFVFISLVLGACAIYAFAH
jgi:transcriptional regulator with XRE-family HTH domain